MVVLDTDVLLIAFRYQRDARLTLDSSFLSKVKGEEPCNTVCNLMDFLGQTSFSVSSERLRDRDRWLMDGYSLSVVWPEGEGQEGDMFFYDEIYTRPFSKMEGAGNGMGFSDALVVGLAERTPDIDALVTWNTRHFRDKTGLSVPPPEE